MVKKYVMAHHKCATVWQKLWRKGTPGDWKNHFTPKITEYFKERWGEMIVKLGYEKDLDWGNS